jgi:glutaryl-CoA dehydrogenase
MITRSKTVPGGYLLTCAKMWISNWPFAEVFVVWTKEAGGILQGFILERGWKGLSAPAIHAELGLRASSTGEIVMDDLFCP